MIHLVSLIFRLHNQFNHKEYHHNNPSKYLKYNNLLSRSINRPNLISNNNNQFSSHFSNHFNKLFNKQANKLNHKLNSNHLPFNNNNNNNNKSDFNNNHNSQRFNNRIYSNKPNFHNNKLGSIHYFHPNKYNLKFLIGVQDSKIKRQNKSHSKI